MKPKRIYFLALVDEFDLYDHIEGLLIDKIEKEKTGNG